MRSELEQSFIKSPYLRCFFFALKQYRRLAFPKKCHMKLFCFLSLFLFVCLISFLGPIRFSYAQDKQSLGSDQTPTGAFFTNRPVIRLASLEWPPYTGANLPDQGASALVARRAFAAMGYDIEISFLPWQRAVKATENQIYDALFPEYFSERRLSHFIYSHAMGSSPLGFMQHQKTPIRWQTLSDLKSHVIGTVKGYVNTAQFDYLAQSGQMRIEPEMNDYTNMRKVAMGRIPLAIIDQNVLRYLKNTYRHHWPQSQDLVFNAKILENKMLFLCAPKTEAGRKTIEIFNQGLTQINPEEIMNRYFLHVLGQNSVKIL